MTQYILSLDQGTTSSRAILFNHAGDIINTAQQEFTQIFPQPGWVEHDPEEIWNSQLKVAKDVVATTLQPGDSIAAIGITNQRETTIVWDKSNGKPIYNAIVWQDRRTADFCDSLKTQKKDAIIKDKTGLVLDAYFSATKIKWILDNVEGAREKAEKSELAFGTVDTWLLWNLTDGKIHATDVSNASRTMLLDIHTRQWDEELMEIFDIPASILPKVVSSSELYGNTSKIIANTSIPVAGIAGDQQAALFGQQCIHPGMVKNTYGTGCFMLMNTGDKPVVSNNNLLTTIAWEINGKTEYALEGSVFIGGAVIQWLRDGLNIIEKSVDVEKLAQKVQDSDGIYIVPAFAGLGAPYWDQHARGTIVGLTRGINTAHIARAALDSIAYQTSDVLKAMEADAKIPILELRVDGGATVNDLLMQFQSDILNVKVVRPKIIETTALGAAYLAGLAVGFWKSADEISSYWQQEKLFTSQMEDTTRNELMKGWQRAVKSAIAWSTND